MLDEPHERRAGPARFAVYGVMIGLAAGMPLGIILSQQPWMASIGSAEPTAEVRETLRHDPLKVFNLDGVVVPTAAILHGGPPKDGIPSLLDPAHVPAAAADHLADDDRVVGVTIGDEQRAYPIRLLNYHEVVNDELGGKPIAVVYCPLCDSVSVVDRRIDDETLSFGVSGLLLNSNVLMFDRTHDALWTQLGGRAISGPWAGRALAHVNSWQVAPFRAWADRHPEGTVLTLDTGYRRNYDRSPYADYFEHDELYFPCARDDRLAKRKEPVVAIRLGDETCAVPVEAIAGTDGGRLAVPIAGATVILESDADTGAVTVVDAPDEAHVAHTFWFAWAAFHPETRVHGAAVPTTAPTTSPAER